ncbi:uncharacterized protein EI90DRAFT_3031118, partial [Cantharellus anzutake]|uniref:uncharacterized protein n=1 Tax=Cantharellus anzutake TaxID=1750568 RepID=UPI001907DFBF
MSSVPSGSVQDSSTTPNDPPKWGRTYATNGPFVRPRQDDFRVAVLSLTPSTEWEQSYRLFIAVSDIYRTTKRFESDFHTTKGKILDDNLDANSDADCVFPIHVSWDDWGPRSARLLATAGTETFCSIFMNRYIFGTLERVPMPETREDSSQWDWCTRLHILDFNPYPIRAESIRVKDDTASASNNLFRDEYPLRRTLGFPIPIPMTGLSMVRMRKDNQATPEPPSSGLIRPPRISKDYGVSGRMTVSPSPDAVGKVITRLPYRGVTSDDTFRGYLLPWIDAERILLLDSAQGTIKVLV